MRKIVSLILIVLGCFAASAQVSKQLTIATNGMLFGGAPHTNFFRTNLLAGTGVGLSFDSVGRVTVSATGSGSVTSVGLSLPSFITVSGSPVTSSGTLSGSLANQSANTVFAGPTTGSAAAPAFRSLVAADIPDLSGTYQPLDTQLTSLAGLSVS